MIKIFRKKAQQIDPIAAQLKRQQKTCVALVGQWGSGKTYRWNADIKQHVKKYVYISGFGKSELSEFKMELLDKIIKLKSNMWHLCMKIVITTAVTLLVGGIIFGVRGFQDRQWFWISLGVLAVISFLLTCWFYRPLLKYFAMKLLGIDHNNIDFARLWHSTRKPVICFDDMERITGTDTCQNLLGFIEELKNYGYPILLMLNAAELPDAQSTTEPNDQKDIYQGLWQRFKEKVITNTYEQEATKDILKNILQNSKLDEDEQAYVETVFDRLYTFYPDESVFKKEHFPWIQCMKNNFRLIEKIVDNIKYTKEHITNYDNLPKYIKNAVLSYIGIQTVIQQYDIPDAILYDGELHIPKDENEDIGSCLDTSMYRALSGQYVAFKPDYKTRLGWFFITTEPHDMLAMQPIKKLLLGTLDENFDIQLNTTQTEQLSQFMPGLMRTVDVRKCAAKLYDSMITEDTPFSSLNTMAEALRRLMYCWESMDKVFNPADFKDIIKIMDKTIRLKEPSPDGFTRQHELLFHLFRKSGFNKDSFGFKALGYLGNEFIRLKKIYWLESIQAELLEKYLNPKTLEERQSCLEALMCSPSEWEKLVQKKNGTLQDYDDYVHIMEYIVYDLAPLMLNQNLTEERKKHVLEFKKKVEDELNSLKHIDGAGVIEQSLSDDWLRRLNGNS